MAFAKLFDVEGFGQVLAKLGTDVGGSPELRWFAEPPELGVCEFALGFEDGDEAMAALESIAACPGDNRLSTAIQWAKAAIAKCKEGK